MPLPSFFLPFFPSSPSSLSFLSLNRDVIPARELRRVSLPMLPSLRMTIDADDIVEESEILSVERLRRELNSERDFFFCTVAVDSSSPATVPFELSPTLDLPVRLELLFGCASSSSSSRSVEPALRDNARRRRPLRPPLRTPGAGSSIAARSLSSRDMRFSAAVYVPCESGDGFRNAAALWAAADVADDEAADGRDVPVDELDEEEVVR